MSETVKSFGEQYEAHKESAAGLTDARANEAAAEDITNEIKTEVDLETALQMLEEARTTTAAAQEKYDRILQENAASVTPEMIDAAYQEFVAAVGVEANVGETAAKVETTVNPQQSVEEAPDAPLKADFERVLGQNWDHIPMGTKLSSELPGILAINVIRPAGKTQNPVSLYMIQGNRGFTLQVTRSGEIVGQVPREVRAKGIGKDEILKEVLKNIEHTGITDWVDLEAPILSPEATGESRPLQFGEKGVGKEMPLDPIRLARLQKHPRRILGVYGTEGLGRGYHAIIFDRTLVIENQRVGNAGFIVDLENPIDPAQVPKDPDARRQWIKDQEFAQYLTSGKRQLVQGYNAKRIVHGGDWETRMDQALQESLERVK